MRGARAYIAFIVVFGGLLITSCKKHTIDQPNSTDPVFTAEGTIDGSAFNLVAGDDNAYMFTSIQEENGVQLFTGNLSDGDLSVEIGIYDGMIDIPGHVSINSLPSDHVFSKESTAPVAVLSKDAFPNVDVIDYVVWTVDGGAPVTNDLTIMEPGKYQVCATIYFTDSSSEELCSEMILGYERHANCTIKHFLNQNGTLTAWVVDPQVAIEKVEWFLNDVLISENPEFAYDSLPGGNHILRSQISFENGAKRTKSMIVDGDLSGKFIDDITFFETSTLALLYRDFNIRVKLEENGITYASDIINNNANTVSFEDVSYYGKDVNGNSVYKVRAHVVATVQDVQNVNGTLDLDFETTFGIAFPTE
ncbi:MAG: hypothetical protein P8P74_01990 [Crocinitomicaceae bacterium]|nr:hypothetical protein [Crocinitomicaceae bacterium]